jgi:nucleotide-binding universal stress UspA family protein
MTAPALRLRHLLCPTDFSDFSVHARSHATAIARAFGAGITFVHVHPSDLPLGGDFAYLAPPPLDSQVRGELENKLSAFTAAAKEAGVPAQSLLLDGDPSREVARLAKELPADLVVVGLHPDSRVKQFLLGSMTQELLRHSPCPVLTVRHGVGPAPEAGAPFRRILCGTDLRAAGPEVVSYALSLAETFRAELTLLHVLERVPEFEPGSALQFTAVEIQAFRQALAEDARDRLRAVAPEEARERLSVRDLVKAGSAHEHILRVAREEGSELIVLGARGHGTLERLLFGSTSRRVVRDAPCPVLIVRGTAAAGAKRVGRVESRHAVGV